MATMTDQEFKLWLMQPDNYIVLVEISTDIPKFISYGGYVSETGIEYRGLIKGGVAFTETVNTSGQASISIGDIEILNSDGIMDEWLLEVFVNKPIRIYVGDASWKREDFRLVLDGICGDINSSSVDSLVITLKDKLQRLNSPVTEDVIGGSDITRKDNIVPLLFGECHNIECQLIDEPNHEYKVHNGAIERIIEVRDYGVPVSTTENLSNGTFKLNQQPAGTITASVQGRTPYKNTIVGIIKDLVQNYGTPSERFTSSDIDELNFSTFDSTHPAPVGLYLDQKSNVLQACQELAGTYGAQVLMSRLGKLRLLQFKDPESTSEEVIDFHNYEEGSLRIVGKTEVQAGVRLGYCKNWLVQNSLDTGIPDEHKKLFGKEYLEVFARDSNVASEYKLYAEPEQENTLFLRTVDAQGECNRRLNLYKKPLVTFEVKCYAEMMLLELGSTVLLKGLRFGLEEGKLGVCTSLSTDFINKTIQVQVTIPWE